MPSEQRIAGRRRDAPASRSARGDRSRTRWRRAERKGDRPGWDGGFYAFMRRLSVTDFGGGFYATRQATIEPVFADTKFNR
jgi:hypothetical protein